ncbi:hypothetical protein FNV43_RR17314 [Rhamnella rubrinervis]|uniref:Uncharacterized protein n=1 Tax=Rhamnella rubrinervis TaxID=2594499 RepID=A0A8K0E3W9_9ROSA|nr:hypothetical protein FNV43_RR17314 [Rhamnella rubrinervis]
MASRPLFGDILIRGVQIFACSSSRLALSSRMVSIPAVFFQRSTSGRYLHPRPPRLTSSRHPFRSNQPARLNCRAALKASNACLSILSGRSLAGVLEWIAPTLHPGRSRSTRSSPYRFSSSDDFGKTNALGMVLARLPYPKIYYEVNFPLEPPPYHIRAEIVRAIITELPPGLTPKAFSEPMNDSSSCSLFAEPK